jgi:assimilatory nitrate reductase catalytic subunit
MSHEVRTVCPYCGVGCGVVARRNDDGVMAISGDPLHPANAGRLCVKGAALGETLGLEERLLYPTLRREGALTRASWDDALNTVARGFAKTIAAHGPDAVAFYVSGQLLTEDYYVANKLVKGFFGTNNIDTNSRLCMSSAVAGHKRAFGADSVPTCYDDFAHADLIVLVGSNTAWCHPVIFQRMLAAKEQNANLKFVVIDPRRTATCEQADRHLPIRSGTDVWLFNGLLAYLKRTGNVDDRFVAAHTEGADAAIDVAERTCGDTKDVARVCGLSEDELLAFYALYAETDRVITAFSQGVNQSSAGVDKVNSIINCHLLTGRVGKLGAGPFSITGQPNAMGGREVGGLATSLAAHLEIAEPRHRELAQTFWQGTSISDRAGLKAVDIFNAALAGRVKAIWIMATNPVVSMPDADRVRAALSACELVVVSDVQQYTDTSRYAHVLLPAAAWGEKDGTVTNSERCISRQRAFLPLPGEAKPDWWIVTQVAQRMGYAAAFGYQSAYEVFLEHTRMSAYRNVAIADEAMAHNASLFRDFNLAGLTQLTRAEYDELTPVQWPVLPASGEDRSHGAWVGTPRLFTDGRFFTPSHRANVVPIAPRAPVHAISDDFPFVLNTGRVRDQWHTMTRTGRSPRLASHSPEPFVEIHPHDALVCGVREGRLARVHTRWGSCVVRVRAVATVPRKHVFVPIHWNDQTASDARVGALVNPVVDPISGEPEFKHTPAHVEPFEVDWYGFVLTRRPKNTETWGQPGTATATLAWWSRIQGQCLIRYELAGRGRPPDWSPWAKALLASTTSAGDWLEMSDVARGHYCAAHIVDGTIEACVFISPHSESLPARAWLSGLFLQDRLSERDRISLLAGVPPTKQTDTGPTVCACFGVGRNSIVRAIRQDKINSIEALGRALKCGTNCGSCIPELKSLLAQAPFLESDA